jgi:hypothetical protein
MISAQFGRGRGGIYRYYRYIITPNTKQTLLNSKTIEVRVGDTNRSLMLENFSSDCPKVTVQGCDLTTT